MFQGTIVALITPFKGGYVDREKLRELIEDQIAAGTDGIVPCGCTGEAATLSEEETREVISVTVETVAGRVSVIAGTGSNSTDKAVKMTRFARESGADGALVITPYYNKPTQAGLSAHFNAVAAAADIPLVLYNVPGRTGVSIHPATVAELAQVETIVAIKEASGSLDQVSDVLNRCDITVLSGDDSLTLPMLAVGARGVISVVANVAPADLVDMVDSFESGDLDRARRLHDRMFPLVRALFVETNPGPVKKALELLGRYGGEIRRPLVPVSPESALFIANALTSYGLELPG